MFEDIGECRMRKVTVTWSVFMPDAASDEQILPRTRLFLDQNHRPSPRSGAVVHSSLRTGDVSVCCTSAMFMTCTAMSSTSTRVTARGWPG